MSATESKLQGQVARPMAAGVIDCDVHPLVPGGIRSLFPYLTRAMQRRFADREQTLSNPHPRIRYNHPAGNILRRDATPPAGGLPGSDPDFVRTDFLDRYGIDRAILNPLQGGLLNAWVDATEATALASAYNQFFAERWLSADLRFRLSMVVAPQDPVAAAGEIRRFGPIRGVVAVFLPLLNILIGNRYYHPILEAAEELGLPILLHPTGAEGNYLGAPVFAGGIPSTYTERYILVGQVAQSNLVSLITEGVFERFQKLKVIFVEYGWGWLPGLLWRMDSSWRALRFEIPWVKRLPSEYVLEHVRFTTEPLYEPERSEHLDQILRMVRADRILMFSSDYPHWDADRPDLALSRIPADLRDRVATDNAVETFGTKLIE